MRTARTILLVSVLGGIGLAIAWWGRGEGARLVDPGMPRKAEPSTSGRLDDPSASLPASTTRVVVGDAEGAELTDGESSSLNGASSDVVESATATTGLDLWFLVCDESMTPLMHAGLSVSWGDGTVHGVPRDGDGYIHVLGVPAGEITVDVTCRGYVAGDYRTIVPWDPPRVEAIVLDPAVTVTGEVRREGEAPGAVRVVGWRDGEEKQAIQAEVSEEAGGAFELRDVPLGPVRFVAISSQWGQSEVVELAIEVGDTPHVVLELDPGRGRVAHGVVVDQATGKPLASATARLMAGGGGPVAEVASAPAQPDGSFWLAGAASAGSLVVAEAPGYSRQTREVVGAGPEVDLGTIALPRTQTLTICLVSDGALDPRGYSIHSQDGRIPFSRFDEQGCLVLEEMSAEVLDAMIRLPDETFLRVRATLEPGEDWRVEVPVQGYASAHVTIGDVAIESRALLTLLYQPGPGVQLMRMAYVLDHEPFVLDGLPPCELLATLGEGEVDLASVEAVVRGTDPIEIRLGDQAATRVRVVDENGAPIAGASVLCSPGGGFEKRTDELGICSFVLKDDAAPAHAAVRHPERGFRPAIPIPRSSDAPFDVVLHATGSLAIDFRSPDASVAGLICSLGDPVVEMLFQQSKNTDANGTIRWERLADGRYQVWMSHASFFPYEETLEVAGTTRVERVLRGRGALVLTVTDGEGVPLAGMPVALRSLADDLDVTRWAEREWITLPAGGLVTDASGRLALEGLASGPYEWRAAGASGTATVVTGTTAREQAVVE